MGEEGTGVGKKGVGDAVEKEMGVGGVMVVIRTS